MMSRSRRSSKILKVYNTFFLFSPSIQHAGQVNIFRFFQPCAYAVYNIFFPLAFWFKIEIMTLHYEKKQV